MTTSPFIVLNNGTKLPALGLGVLDRENRDRTPMAVETALAALDGIHLPEITRDTIRCHHEHWDGGGYPEGLAGQEIPLGARIVAVADAFVAMISTRAHRLAKRVPVALEDIRKEKPYQLEDRVEQLFHEKSVTGYGAWNRLFDESIARLQFKVGRQSLAIEPTLSLLQDPDGERRKAAAEALAKTFKANLPQFALITNTLAKDK